VCGLGVGRGAGEGRQDTQDIEKDNGLKKDGRCMCTGTPTFGLPPVFSGPVAVFMACVYAVFDPMILHVCWSMVGIIPTMQPTVELTGS
jgi:hypothetical protein